MRTQLIIFGFMMALWGCGKSEDTNLAPNQPTIKSPAQGVNCQLLKPSFTWEATDPEEDKLRYSIWIGTEENNLKLESDNLQDTRFTPTENLMASTIYYWQVEAFDGSSSTKSETVSFSTTGEGESGELPSRPVIIAPKNDTSIGNITFSWNASIGGEGNITYDLYVKHGTASSYTLLHGGISGTSHTNSFAAGSLSWYVDAVDSRGQISQSKTITISLN